MKVDTIVIVGTGTTALKCAQICSEANFHVMFFDIENENAILKKKAHEKNISYQYMDKSIAYNTISKMEESVLLFSILNDTIVPEFVINKENIVLVNCHRALLPKHPGRNAEVWAIYEQDKIAGITWHYITKEIDGGDIISQYEIMLDDRITSYGLFKKQADAIVESFTDVLEELVHDKVQVISQNGLEKSKMHYSKDRPNNGELNPDWDFEKTSAFLRAMDYMGLDVVGKPFIVKDGKKYTWRRYGLLHEIDQEKVGNEDIVLEKENKYVWLKKCSEI